MAEGLLTDFKRGDVFLASLDPVVGSEQGKTRPVVIIQNDIANQFSPVVIVAAVTKALSRKDYPTEVFVEAPEGGLKRDSLILLNQVRTIDKQRLISHWGKLQPSTLEKVDEALRISLGLTSF
jgi:mRNA interferase MazF